MLALWFNQATFSGCIFINASAEFPRIEDPCHQICTAHKQAISAYLLTLCRAADALQPERLAKQLALIIEGAIVDAYVNNNKLAAQDAKDLAQLVIPMSLNR